MQIKKALINERLRVSKYAENYTFKPFWSNFPVKFPFLKKSSQLF